MTPEESKLLIGILDELALGACQCSTAERESGHLVDCRSTEAWGRIRELERRLQPVPVIEGGRLKKGGAGR